jgi:hypothetical protein
VKRRIYLFVTGLLVGLISACSVVSYEPTPIPPTSTSTVTPTGTATIIWFPATETPTPRPTQVLEPTAEMRPDIGEILVENLFSKPAQWRTGNFTSGNFTLVNETLTLAIQQPKMTQISLESQNVFRDFNLETKVSINLCRGEDVYGLVVRAASELDYYRFIVNCDGMGRAERVRSGQTTLMQDWMATGIPPGAPQEITLGVWALGKELRFFANDAFVFSVSDPVFTEGRIGVFARASGENPVTISYSEMRVNALAQSQ